MTTLLIVANEASGDIHGANLARQLQALDPSVRLVGMGGAQMRAAGVQILIDSTTHASMGLVEVVHTLHRHAQHYRLLQSALRTHRPDAAVLIDSPDFNLRFAERAVDHGVPVIYYISPQIWAWRKGRLKTIKRLVRKMLVILDFEEKIYRDAGVDVAFVGNPLLDAVLPIDREAVRREWGVGDLLVGLLPGSRRKVFSSVFPILRTSAELIGRELPGTKFVVGCASTIDPSLATAPGLTPVWNRTPEVMAASDLLLVASGTTTLEAAIYGTPMIVTYKLNPISAYLVGPIVYLNTRDFSLVNIVAGRRVVPEYYQPYAKPGLIAREAVSLIREGKLASLREELGTIRRKLGSPGASRRAAEEILKVLRKA
jgi:lipid-A-disaccharide synthase